MEKNLKENRKMIGAVFVYDRKFVVVCDEWGQAVSELQGDWEEKKDTIYSRATAETQFQFFGTEKMPNRKYVKEDKLNADFTGEI